MNDNVRFCTFCGASLHSDSVFCHMCGTKINKVIEHKCFACGEAVKQGAHFCHKCGAKIGEPDIKAPVSPDASISNNLNSQDDIPKAETSESDFCVDFSHHEQGTDAGPECVQSQPSEEPCAVNRTMPESRIDFVSPQVSPNAWGNYYYPRQTNEYIRKKPGIKIAGLIKSGIAAVLSLLVLISGFLPIITCPITIEPEVANTRKELDVSINVTPIDTFVLFIDSLYDVPFEDMEGTDIYYDYQDALGELSEIDVEDIHEKELQPVFKRLVFTVLRAVLRSDTDNANVTQGAVTIISLTFYIIALICFVLSVITVIRCLSGKEPLKAALLFMILLTALFPLRFASELKTGYMRFFGGGVSDLGFDCGTMKIALFPLLIAIACFVFLVVLGVIRVIKAKSACAQSIVKRTISSALCLLMLFAFSMPLVSLTLTGQFGEDNTLLRKVDRDFGLSFFDDPSLVDECYDLKKEGLTEEEISKYISDYSMGAGDAIKIWTAKEIREGNADRIIMALVHSNSINDNFAIAKMSTFIPILMLSAMIFVSLIWWLNLMALVLGKESNFCSIVFKTVAVVCAVTALLLLIIFMISSTRTVTEVGLDYRIAPAYGIIIFIVTSVAVACVPLNVKKRVFEAAPPALPSQQFMWQQ